MAEARISAGTANITVDARGLADASAAHGADAASCAKLTSLKLPHTTITSAQVVPAGQFKAPEGNASFADLPAFCRVSMTIAPSSDSDIKTEIWLPVAGWNGKFQEVGNGGWNGFIQYAALATALRRGYAAASTDTGHVGDTASFAPGHPEKLIDFGYRAVHETALEGKATIAALYGAEPRFSYFTGCSGGGRQAFMEAQRYPEDFEGIVAGDPGYDRAAESLQLIAAAQATHKDAASLIPREKFAVLHQAALDACDALDGIKDGIINNPLRCKFDPGVTLCKGADAPSCLTAAQVEAAKKLYAPIVDPKSGKEIFPGFEPGTELRFANNTVGRAAGNGRGHVQVHRDAEPQLGFPDARYRHGYGAREKDGQRRGERDVHEPEALCRPRRQADHLSRLGRSECRAALVGELLQRADPSDGEEGGGRFRAAVHGAGHGALRRAAKGPACSTR